MPHCRSRVVVRHPILRRQSIEIIVMDGRKYHHENITRHGVGQDDRWLSIDWYDSGRTTTVTGTTPVRGSVRGAFTGGRGGGTAGGGERTIMDGGIVPTSPYGTTTVQQNGERALGTGGTFRELAIHWLRGIMCCIKHLVVEWIQLLVVAVLALPSIHVHRDYTILMTPVVSGAASW